jgi:hypothetical protein
VAAVAEQVRAEGRGASGEPAAVSSLTPRPSLLRIGELL